MRGQLDAARGSAMAEAYGWEFDLQGLVVLVTMRPRRRPDNAYLMRVSFDDFPRRAPSYVFVDRQTQDLTAEAWPPDVKHGDPLPGICTPGTREFHEKYHKNDAQYPWDPEKWGLLDTLQRIQALMEKGLG